MSTKYWVQYGYSNEPIIVTIDVVKETGQRVYFDKKSIKKVLGESYCYVPVWQEKTSVHLFDTYRMALLWSIGQCVGKIKGLKSEVAQNEATQASLEKLLAEQKD